MVKKQSAVHLHLGIGCCLLQSIVPTQFQGHLITYFHCSEQQVIWNGRPEEEGTEGCFSVHAKGTCASIQFTNNTVNRIWYIMYNSSLHLGFPLLYSLGWYHVLH